MNSDDHFPGVLTGNTTEPHIFQNTSRLHTEHTSPKALTRLKCKAYYALLLGIKSKLNNKRERRLGQDAYNRTVEDYHLESVSSLQFRMSDSVGESCEGNE